MVDEADMTAAPASPPRGDKTAPAVRILIAEDDANICNLLASYLSVSGFETESVGDGLAALERVGRRDFDLIILDVMMPGADGLSVCAKIRETKDVPVLLLTALGKEHDRIEGFEAGADDYVVKPFSPRELVSRVKAILRRTAKHAGEGSEPGGGLRIDAAAKQAYFGENPLDLTPSEFKIVAALTARPGFVLSREQLLDLLYPDGESGTHKAVDVHIHNLRKKIGEPGAELLETVRGFGYRVRGHP